QGPVQTRDRAAHQRKARAGQLCSSIKIEIAVPLADSNVILGLEVEGAWRAPAAYLDVIVLATANRYALVRQVGNGQQNGVKLGLDRLQFLLGRIQLGAHAVHVRQQRLDILAPGLGLADGSGATVAFSLQGLGTGLY